MGARAIAVMANVAERSDLGAMLATVTDQLGPADVLVNNAGIGFHADALTLDDADCRRIFDTNLDAVWMASQIVGRQMVTRKADSTINIGSISGLIINRPHATRHMASRKRRLIT
jgi:NAD(P)-dependent dehydrogenase (short-subunit alcohol dehydrogenase family)